MELAVESGNNGTAKLLHGVVEVDERTGTVRLRRDVAAADEMALDARSTRTARVRKEDLMPTCIEGHASKAAGLLRRVRVADRKPRRTTRSSHSG